jgi:hypothetical protein
MKIFRPECPEHGLNTIYLEEMVAVCQEMPDGNAKWAYRFNCLGDGKIIFSERAASVIETMVLEGVDIQYIEAPHENYNGDSAAITENDIANFMIDLEDWNNSQAVVLPA